MSPLRHQPTAIAIVCAAAMLLMPSALIGQDQSLDIGALASALADQRARITQLQEELDQQTAALLELTRRLEGLTPAPALPTSQPTVPSPPPPRSDFYAESKVRYETLRQAFPGCVGCPDRNRGRLRLRFGALGRLSPDFTAVVGLGVGEINDPNTVYVNLGNNFSRKVATWDRGYVEYHPTGAKWMNLTAGKFPYTWVRSSMTFDVDFYPEGLSERFGFGLQPRGRLQNVGVQASS